MWQVRAHNTVLQSQVDAFRARTAALNKMLEASQREKTDLYADRTFDRVVRSLSGNNADLVLQSDDDDAGDGVVDSHRCVAVCMCV